MGRALNRAAGTLGCSDRTLRRYVNDGLLRGRRQGNRVELNPGEESYLRERFAVLRALRSALRTERNVRLAVLFGSAARGDERAASDIDMLVAQHDESPRAQAALGLRLRRAVERNVHVVSLSQAEGAPSLLVDVLTDGRVLVDRDAMWARLKSRRGQLAAAADLKEAELANRAEQAVRAARERI